MIQPHDDRALPVTTARGRLFDLVEELLTGQRQSVELSHRSYDEHVVLLCKGELDRLRADLAALRARRGAEPRPLRGSGELHVEADQVPARVRARQAELARRKRASIVRESRKEP